MTFFLPYLCAGLFCGGLIMAGEMRRQYRSSRRRSVMQARGART